MKIILLAYFGEVALKILSITIPLTFLNLNLVTIKKNYFKNYQLNFKDLKKQVIKIDSCSSTINFFYEKNSEKVYFFDYQNFNKLNINLINLDKKFNYFLGCSHLSNNTTVLFEKNTNQAHYLEYFD